jgi:hypothetical protein
VASRETRDEPFLPPGLRAGDVHHPDQGAVDLDDPLLRQRRSQRGLVHVPVHALDRGERCQLLEHARGHEIAAVQNQLGPLELAQAFVGQPASPAREMSVRDDGDRGDGGVRLLAM